MSKKPVLVVMAAGMGSRYGGLKQIDPVGSHGEAILDYSLFDAYEAGFRTAVIIIKEAIRADFMDTVGARLQKAPVEIRYAYQELDMLPAGYTVPAGRTKPWGTSHAVLCAREAIGDAPFAVINADDYYGKSAYRVMYEALSKAQDGEKLDYCMVGYEVGKTVTEHGSVARALCLTDEMGCLTQVIEQRRIEKYEGGIHYTEDGENWVELAPDTLVSMNIWGFTPSFLTEVEKAFTAFLDDAQKTNPLNSEYLLPVLVQHLLTQGNISVKVLTSSDQWHGVTYAADKPLVVAALQEKTREGLYPASLWD